MGCFAPDPPPTPNYSQINRDTLQSQIDLAPDKLAAEQQTRPGYTALELQEMEHALLGNDQSKGILRLLEEDVLPAQQRATTAAQKLQREGDLRDMQELGPQYIEALKSANPDQAALVDKLTTRANQGMDQGLSEFERHRFEQNWRSANRGRLGNTGTAGAAAETFYMADRERDRDLQNRQLAMQAVGLNQSVYGDPFLQITGRQSGAVPYANATMGQGQGIASMAGPQLFNERDPLAHNLALTGYQAQVDSQIAGANAMAGMIGGGIGALGKIGGAWLGKA